MSRTIESADRPPRGVGLRTVQDQEPLTLGVAAASTTQLGHSDRLVVVGVDEGDHGRRTPRKSNRESMSNIAIREISCTTGGCLMASRLAPPASMKPVRPWTSTGATQRRTLHVEP